MRTSVAWQCWHFTAAAYRPEAASLISPRNNHCCIRCVSSWLIPCVSRGAGGLSPLLPSTDLPGVTQQSQCRRDEHQPRTDGGSSGPPRKPPGPPKATAEGAWNDGDDRPQSSEGWGWKGWKDRVSADPQFAYKVLVEQIIGVGAAVLGDMSTRPNWGINELDFVFSTLIVGSLMNFLLMYLLAPVAAPAAGGAAVSRGLGKLFDEKTLLNMGAPGGHVFERGFSMKGRAINMAFKSFTFGIIGFAAGLAGTCISNGLIAVRKRCDPQFVSQNESPNVLLNSMAWTVHMGISSNIRYQLLNGFDMVRLRSAASLLSALCASASVSATCSDRIPFLTLILRCALCRR